MRRVMVGCALLLASCGGGDDASAPTTRAPETVSDAATSDADLANPAAVFCEEQGGKAFGPEPMCGLPDGTTIDAWEYYRSETSEADASTPTTPATSSPSEQSAAATTTPTSTTTVPEVLVIDSEYGEWRQSYPTIAELPSFPITVTGYVPVTEVQRTMVRVFDNTPVVTIDEFPWQGNRCEYGYWVARWVSSAPDVLVYASNEIVYNDPGTFVRDTSMLPPAAPAGVLGAFACTTPGFFWSPSNSTASTLVDVAVEWQYYELDWFEENSDVPTTNGEATNDSATSCGDYVYNDQLPIYVCSQGFSVELFQEALGLEPDGYFGPGTELAVREYQQSVGLPASGVMDATTWAALGVTDLAPFPDLNGDGVVDGSEFPFD